MIITIGGKPGSGKTTVAKIAAKKLGYKHVSIGDLRGRLAQKHGMTIDEFNQLGMKEEWTDKETDKELQKLIGKGDIIIDTWVGYHFIPDSIKIYLEVDYKEGARRIFKDQRPDEPKKKTVEEVEKMIKKRVEDSRTRYKKWYDTDILDMSNYDLIIDTTKLNREEVVDKILEFIRQQT